TRPSSPHANSSPRACAVRPSCPGASRTPEAEPAIRPLRSPDRREESPSMTFTLRGLGTAVPQTRLTQEEALGLARVLCCRTSEQMTWVPLMYTQTGIEARHVTLPRAVVEDVLQGTRHTGHVFLLSESLDDPG